MRTPSLLAAAALVVSSFAANLVPGTASAMSPATVAPPVAVAWCDSTPAPPCIESATLDGTDLETLGPTWTLQGWSYSGASKDISVNLVHDGDLELGAAALSKVVV